MEDSSNTVKYTFTADASGLEEAVDGIKSKVDDLKKEAEGIDIKVNWGEGEGTIEDYNKWLERTTKETEDLARAQKELSGGASQALSSISPVVGELEEVASSSTSAGRGFGGLSEGIYSAIGGMNDLSPALDALIAAISTLTVKAIKGGVREYTNYEDKLYSLAATVSTVEGTISDAMANVRAISSEGILSEQQTTTAIRNLTAYGYSVQEATDMINAMTASAEANRREGLSVGEAVVTATQGIEQESAMMMKAAGNTELASEAEARYAEEIGKTKDAVVARYAELIGKTPDQLTSAERNYAESIAGVATELTDAERRQALYNSTIEAGEKYAETASYYQGSLGASAQVLSNSIDKLRESFGRTFAPVLLAVSSLAQFAAENADVVAVVGSVIAGVVGAGGLLWAFSKLIPMVVSAIAWFSGLSAAGKGVIATAFAVGATLGAVAGIAGLASATVAQGLENVANEASNAADSTGGASKAIDGLGASAGNAASSAQDLGKQLEKLRRDYLEDLKQIEVSHLETIENLTKQIKDANVDYRRAVEERNAAFEVSQAEEERAHQEKVDELMTQIDFLRKYNNDYNKQKLANLEFALAKENNLYQKQTEAAKAELELQNENDRQAYEEKRAALQAELDDELAFMDKHRDALKEVQDVILLDEIESLQRRYEEQKASYEEQASLAGVAGGNIADQLLDEFNTKVRGNQSVFSGLGEKSAISYTGSFIDNVNKFLVSDNGFFAGLSRRFQNLFSGAGFTNEIMNTVNGELVGSGKYEGWAAGGFTGQGNPEEIAGVVHRGEYVLPAGLVNQDTGLPKNLGTTVININVQGTFATSQSERRKVAEQIASALEQVQKSRLIKAGA